MNILIDELPEVAEIDGKEYRLHTDFRTCMRIMNAFEDEGLLPSEKQMIMLELLYEEVPENLEKACELALLFLACGEENAEEEEERESPRLYSFEKDAPYIYTAMKRSYGIDLSTIKDMHWWRFCSLFLDLSEDCFLQRIIYLRSQKAKGKLTKEERQAYYAMKDILELPQPGDAELKEIEQAFMEKLGK